MIRYIIGRLLQAILSLVIISIFVFVLARATGDPTQVLLPMDASQEQYDILRKALHLDKPLLQQYFLWMGDMITGDFGTSATRQVPVTQLLSESVPPSLQLAGAGFALTLLIGVPLGVYSAAHRGSMLDTFARIFAVLGQAMPSFWLGILLITLFAVILGWLPAGGKGGLTSLILPAFTVGWFGTAGVMRLTRSSMLEVLHTEYVKLARIKGLVEPRVLWKHAFKNASLPVLTFGALILFAFVTGALVTETVFSWPGMGTLVLQATINRDFAVVQVVVMLISMIYIMGNLIIDVLYAYLNPRIRYG